MSKVLKIKIKDCDNHYTAEDLFSRFGIDDREVQTCMKCKNCILESGIISCKHMIDKFENAEGIKNDN